MTIAARRITTVGAGATVQGQMQLGEFGPLGGRCGAVGVEVAEDAVGELVAVVLSRCERPPLTRRRGVQPTTYSEPVSPGSMPAARTAMTTSPGAGSGIGTSVTSEDGPPAVAVEANGAGSGVGHLMFLSNGPATTGPGPRKTVPGPGRGRRSTR
ncbi:hypothetical protein M2271_006628 [Streptomyces sp. LBL]|uniref:hypothetical protein n=1 Tax=Streptomyces sp. LBL TaxID=2940562 RepID=UPI002475E319|nr:hypothetical protein [Streptomyces sp. LBL]MDH6628793.1 hypothetical protein [Streptomyces sp. LBL]